MSKTSFHHPVAFRLGNNRIVVIRSVEKALDFLENRWPEVGEDLYLAARSACLEALVNPAKVNAARHAFVDALLEAGLEPAFEFGFMAGVASPQGRGAAS